MPVPRLVRTGPTGLRKRLLFLVLASVLPFLLLIGMVARRQFLEQKPLAAERALARAQRLADQFDDRFSSIESVMRAVSLSLGARPADKPGNDRIMQGLRGTFGPGFASWRLFDPSGRLLGTSIQNDRDAPRAEYMRSLWAGRYSGQNAFVSEPMNTPSAGYIVHMILPMRDARGDSAFIAAQLRLQSLQPLIDARGLPEGSAIVIINERGIVVGRSPDPQRWVGRDLSSYSFFRSSLGKWTDTREDWAADSVERVLAVAHLRNAPWLAWAGIPMSAVYAQTRADFTRAVGWGTLALGLALVLAMWQASRIIAPLAQLSADAATLGTGNLSHRSGVLGTDEFGALAATINEMATTLEQQGTVLRENEERYRGLFDINPLPMLVLNPETLAFLAVNRAAIEVYGHSEPKFLAMKVSDVHPAEDEPALMTHLAQSQGKTQRYLTRHRRKDGTVFHVEIDSAGITFAGRPARLVVVHDVSERIRAEKALRDAEMQLRQSQRLEAVGQLTGGIAHDFNNVLTAIGSYSYFLYESLDPSDARRLDIQEIRKAADRAAGLTKQLLAFSRSQILQPRVLDINAALVELEALLRRLLSADLELVFALAPDAGRVRVDPGQLAQVMINLAVNSRDAMPDGGVLTISTRNETVSQSRASGPLPQAVAPGEYVVIEVVDTGTGMDRETLSRIFEPFFTTKGPAEGTGLGLSTVHGIVHQSGGHVSAASQPGIGTTFTILFPRVDQPVEPEEPRPVRAVPGNRNEIVLVVEDEEAVR